jgi:hypothetical protein
MGSGDTAPGEYLPIVFLQHHDFYLEDALPPSGPSPYYVRLVHGRVVSNYPIVPGLLNVPTFAVASWFGFDLQAQRFTLSHLTSAVVTALSAALMFLALSSVCRKRSTAVFFTCIYAFATCAWSVASRGLWQHGPGMMFLTGALVLLLYNKRRASLAGFFLGMAVFTRPANIVFALALSAYVLSARRKIAPAFFAWAAIPAFLLAWYSLVYWGSVLALGQGQGDSGFTGNVLIGLPGLLVSPGRGLFYFSPVFLFVIPEFLGIFRWPNWREPYIYMAASVLLSLLLFAAWGVWWGGHSYGYRLLLESIPFLILFLARAYERFIANNRFVASMFFAMLGLSICVQLVGLLSPCGYNYVPDDINKHTQRLWDYRDSEVIRCTKGLIRQIKLRF